MSKLSDEVRGKKPGLAIVVAPKEDDAEEGDVEGEAESAACEEILSAVKAGDAEALASALRAFMDCKD